MKYFITGTDTNVGKTVIASWLCLHLKADYFKPIEAGFSIGSENEFVKKCSGVHTHKGIFNYQAPLSPHLAARLENDRIDLHQVTLPASERLIVEGAGGLLVPLNEEYLMIDLIQQLSLPVILVARTALGTINHTLLSLEALRARNIPIHGVILNGEPQFGVKESIERYGQATIIAEFPLLQEVTFDNLKAIPLPSESFFG